MDPWGPTFKVGLFDCWACQPMKSLREESATIRKLFIKYIINIFMAPLTVAKASARLNGSTKVWAYAIPSVLTFSLFILCHLLDLAYSGCWAIAWFFYCCFATYLTAIRITCRERFNICGNPFEDFFASLFLYPNVALQLDETTKELDVGSSSSKDKKQNIEMAAKDPENGLPTKNDSGNVNTAYES
jgi:hypothetical protein